MKPHRVLSHLIRLLLAVVVSQFTYLGSASAQQAPANNGGTASQTNTKTKQQNPASTPAKRVGAASNIPLQAVATVNASITVEAGLLPRDSASQLFSGWVADHFAVVQITIGNHSRDQQFILQDVFFDYSHWALSGLYTAGQPTKALPRFQDYQQGTTPGEISSIGALEVHDGLKSYSVFSPRNTWVNGLILVGSTAGGFAFLGPLGFTQAMTGYNSAFIPALQKFWPDRSIDQQTNLLKYGFQDKMVIAKEDPGKTYAFFPIARFLSNGLADLYRTDPAIFFNPAELFLDTNLPVLDGQPSNASAAILCDKSPHRSDCKHVVLIKQRLFNLIDSQSRASTGKPVTEAEILSALTSPCHVAYAPSGGLSKEANQNQRVGEGETTDGSQEKKKDAVNANPDNSDTDSASQAPEQFCPLDPSKDEDKVKIAEIQRLKNLMAGASLNSVHIVVSGIMTVDVETIPATITGVSFDGQDKGESFWSDTKDKQTGVITGKYLTNGKPVITAIKLPATSAETSTTPKKTAPTTTNKTPVSQGKKGTKTKAGAGTPASDGATDDSTDSGEGKNAGGDNTGGTSEKNSKPQVGDYFDTKTLAAVQEGSTDSELHFSVQFKKQIPPGSTVTFQVVKTSSKSVNNDNTGANTAETTSSMTYDYLVDYKAATPKPASEPEPEAVKPDIKNVTIKGETAAAWAAKGNAIAGTITGTDLDDGTVEIKQITIPGKTKTKVSDYVTQKDINSGTAGSSATNLNFTLTLSNAIPPGAELIFAVTTKDKNGKESVSNLKTHSIPKAAAKKVAKPPSGGGKK